MMYPNRTRYSGEPGWYGWHTPVHPESSVAKSYGSDRLLACYVATQSHLCAMRRSVYVPTSVAHDSRPAQGIR